MIKLSLAEKEKGREFREKGKQTKKIPILG